MMLMTTLVVAQGWGSVASLLDVKLWSFVLAIWFICACPVRLIRTHGRTPRARLGTVFFLKLTAAFVLLGLRVTDVIIKRPQKEALALSILQIISASLVCCISYIDHVYSARPSTLLSIYLFFSVILDAVRVSTQDVSTWTVSVAIILLLLEARSKKTLLRNPFKDYPPESTSGVFSRRLLLWITPLLLRGYSSFIRQADLFDLDEELSSGHVSERLQSLWQARSNNGSFALARASISSIRKTLLLAAIPRALLMASQLSQPLLLKVAIELVQGKHSLWNSPRLLLAAVVVYLGNAIFKSHHESLMTRAKVMLRTSLISIIYSKSLHMRSKDANETLAVGLISTDVDMIVGTFSDLHGLWAHPIEIGIALWILQNQLGWAFLTPVVFAFIVSFAAVRVATLLGSRSQKRSEAVQERLAMTSVMLNSIKEIKMMGFTEPIATKVKELREINVKRSQDFAKVIAALNIVANTPEFMSPVLTFFVAVIISRFRGHTTFTVAEAFASLSALALLNHPLGFVFATLSKWTASMASFKRIQGYLLIPDYAEERNVDESNQSPLRVTNVSVASGTKEILHDIDLNARRGELIMITGPVAAGKSVLLKSLLGEFEIVHGSISIDKDIAFCEQKPWIRNATVQENIVWPSSFDAAWYEKVVFASGLHRDDLDLHGKSQLVGNSGITLSGGQKQRIALARAAYARKPVVLLDDPLSSLDWRTQEHVFQNLLGPQGLFKDLGTTVIMITQNNRVFVFGQTGFKEQNRLQPHQLDNKSEFQDDSPSNEANKPERETAEDLHAVLATGDELQDLLRQGDFGTYQYFWKLLPLVDSTVYLLLIATSAFCLEFTAMWVKWWSESEARSPGKQTWFYLGGYALLSILSVLHIGLTIWALFVRVVPAYSTRAHQILLDTVISLPLSVFASDQGSIFNRFSHDIDVMDKTLCEGIMRAVSMVATCIVGLILVMVSVPKMTILVPLLFLVIYFLQKFYLKTSRQLRYLELESKAPLYTHFRESMNGLATIRAFGWQKSFLQKNDSLLDEMEKPYYLLLSLQIWLNLVLDIMVGAVAVAVLSFALTQTGTNGGSLGVALFIAISFGGTLANLMEGWTLLETSLGAIARLKAFAESAVPEGANSIIKSAPKNWPSKGKLEVRALECSYITGSTVLKKISCTIEAGQRVAIVGRSGSGKSSLFMTLLRLLQPDHGSVVIDDVDISQLAHSYVRATLCTIPQDTLVLPETVRFNLDPNLKESDDALIGALEKVGLYEAVKSKGGLDGDFRQLELSHGQTQLFGFARASLRKSPILLMDEATSSLDHITESKIHDLLRGEFAAHTLIIIAHKLDSILDLDKVLVLENGELVETGVPAELLKQHSKFRRLYESQQDVKG